MAWLGFLCYYKSMKKLTAIVFGLLVILSVAGSPFFARAADYLPKEKTDGGNVTVSGDTPYKNLFIGGANVFVNQKILGDLFSGGGSVNIASPVEEDLFAVGGNVIVSAPVGGDARLAGGNVSVNSPIGGDLMIGGGTVNVGSNASIAGDFWTGAGILNLNSNIKGNLKAAGDEILINGEVRGDAEIRSGKKLVFGPNSRVAGKITHWGANEAVVQDGAQISQIQFQKIEKVKTRDGFGFTKVFGVILLVKILALFIGALLLLKFFGRTSYSVVSRPHAKPWASLGVGLLGIVILPVAAIVLMVTAVGLWVGSVLLFVYITILLLASVFTVLFIGTLLERWLFKKELNLTWKTAAWGVAVGAVVYFVPIVGCLAIFATYLMVFGSSLQEIKSRLEN